MFKQIIPAWLAQLAPKPLLETEEDVEEYLTALRNALIDKIQQNNRVRIE